MIKYKDEFRKIEKEIPETLEEFNKMFPNLTLLWLKDVGTKQFPYFNYIFTVDGIRKFDMAIGYGSYGKYEVWIKSDIHDDEIEPQGCDSEEEVLNYCKRYKNNTMKMSKWDFINIAKNFDTKGVKLHEDVIIEKSVGKKQLNKLRSKNPNVQIAWLSSFVLKQEKKLWENVGDGFYVRNEIERPASPKRHYDKELLNAFNKAK